jgi:hypothetical protein
MTVNNANGRALSSFEMLSTHMRKCGVEEWVEISELARLANIYSRWWGWKRNCNRISGGMVPWSYRRR